MQRLYAGSWGTLLIHLVHVSGMYCVIYATPHNCHGGMKQWHACLYTVYIPVGSKQSNIASFAVAVSYQEYRLNHATKFLDNVQCTGTESSILDCSHSSGVVILSYYCEAAGVACPCK